MNDREEDYAMTFFLGLFVLCGAATLFTMMVIEDTIRGWMPDRKPKLTLLQGGKK